MDQTDQAGEAQTLESILKERLRRLCAQALSPILFVEQIRDLDLCSPINRPGQQPAPANELLVWFIDSRPEAPFRMVGIPIEKPFDFFPCLCKGQCAVSAIREILPSF